MSERILIAGAAFAFSLTSVLSLAAQEPPVVPLWLNGAPGFEARKDTPENVKKKGKLEQSVTNVKTTQA